MPPPEDRPSSGISGDSLLWLVSLLTAAIVPLFFNPWHAHSFELPKALLLRGLGGAAFVLLTLQLLRRQAPWIRHNPLLRPALAFTAALVLALIRSADPHISLWGSYERQFGILTWLALPLLLLSLSAALRTKARLNSLWSALVWTSLPITTYAALQHLGLDPLAWQTDGTTPLIGTLGRSNFLAAYLIMVIPLTAASLLTAARRWPLALLLGLQLIILFATRARAAWIGMLTGVLLFTAVSLLRHRPISRRQTLLLGFLLLPPLLIAGALWLTSSGILEAGSPAARLAIWRATLPLLPGGLISGYGPETLGQLFNAVFPPELVYYQGRHLGVDRAHNLWLDLLLTGGLPLLLAFLWLAAAFFRLVHEQLRRPHPPAIELRWLALASAVTAHLVELQFSFETVSTATFFWTLLGMAGALTVPAPETVRPPRPSRPLLPFLPAALIFLSLTLLVTIRPWLADAAYLRAMTAGPTAEGLQAAYRAAAAWPVEPEYHLALGQQYWLTGRPAAAAASTRTAVQLRPRDSRLWAALGDLYGRWGGLEQDRLVQAQAAYEQAAALAPNRATYHVALGQILAARGQLPAAVAALERAVNLDATDGVAYTHLSDLYRRSGRPAKARQAGEQAALWQTNIE